MDQWLENAVLLEAVFSKIRDIDTFIVFSRVNTTTADVSNTKRVQDFIIQNVGYLVRCGSGTQRIFLKPFRIESIDKDSKCVMVCSQSSRTTDDLALQRQIVSKCGVDVPFVGISTTGWQEREEHRRLTERAINSINFSWTNNHKLLFCYFGKQDPNRHDCKNCFHYFLDKGLDWNTYEYINRALYHQSTDETPGSRVVTVYDVQSPSLPRYFLI